MSKNSPVDKTLYALVVEEAKRRFAIWPSAYASGWVVKEYKRRGGRYSGKKKTNTGVGRWFREKWINVCELPKVVPCARKESNEKFPYCRPMVKVSPKTPKLASEFSPSQIKKLCATKRRNPSKRMKPHRRKRSRSRRKSRRRSKSRSRQKCIFLSKSLNKTKKWKVYIPHKNCTVHFGGAGYSDYTLHKDPKRKALYVARHKKRENWTKSGICTAGFWSKHLLWNLPSLSASKKDMEKRFSIKFCSS